VNTNYWIYDIQRIYECSGRRERLLPEADWEKNKEAIVFFDKLGFGWVLDHIMVEEMKLNRFKEAGIINRSLIRMIENLLDNPGV
jgi:hypothetical protein